MAQEKVKSTTSTKVMMGVTGFLVFVCICVGLVSFLDTPSKSSKKSTKRPAASQPVF